MVESSVIALGIILSCSFEVKQGDVFGCPLRVDAEVHFQDCKEDTR